MSLESEESMSYTDIEQSDEEHEQEYYRLSQELVDGQEFPDDFIAELGAAIEDAGPDSDMANLEYPSRGDFDIPRFKIEEEAKTTQSAEDDNAALEEGNGNQDIGNNIVDQLGDFAETQSQGNEEGALEREPKESYDHSWTGM